MEWLTDEQKQALRNPDAEYTLLINENGEYELVRCTPVDACPEILAYSFIRNDRTYVMYWHTTADGELYLPLQTDDLCLEKELGTPLPIAKNERGVLLPVGDRRYISSASNEALIAAFRFARIK